MPRPKSAWKLEKPGALKVGSELSRNTDLTKSLLDEERVEAI